MKRYAWKMHGFAPSELEEDPTGYWVEFSEAADRIEKLEFALKALVGQIGRSVICQPDCESHKHEDDTVPNPHCDCGMCDLIDRADEAALLLNELCTCGGETLHENGCKVLEDLNEREAMRERAIIALTKVS